jgi:hypothetical protein
MNHIPDAHPWRACPDTRNLPHIKDQCEQAAFRDASLPPAPPNGSIFRPLPGSINCRRISLIFFESNFHPACRILREIIVFQTIGGLLKR